MVCVVIFLGPHLRYLICNEAREVTYEKWEGCRAEGFLNDCDIMADGWRHVRVYNLFIVVRSRKSKLHSKMIMST